MEDLLFLAHRIPYPPDKGEKIRAWHFLRHLAGRYRVHLACFVDEPRDAQFISTLEEICASVCWQPLRPIGAKLRAVLRAVGGAPLTRGYFADLRLRQGVDEIVARRRPQRFFVFSSAMIPYIERHRAARCVIDMVDVDSEKWRHYAEETSGLVRIVYAREARTLLDLERRMVQFGDSVLFVSRAEAELFRRLAPETAPRVHHISNGVDTDYFDPALEFADPFGGAPAILFIGAMNYRPNVDAVEWFAREVMPMARALAERPSFWIVGSNPTDGVRRLAADDVHVTGRVEDVRPYLAHAAAVVAPLRIARGVQNKVLEAMAMAAPVVATPQAREGLDACRDDEIIEAQEAAAFSEAIRRMLGGEGVAIGRRARRRMQLDFSWARSFEALDAELDPERFHPPTGASAANFVRPGGRQPQIAPR
ncbi:MAG TPA: TIGR03087 family PEP-CTERM/XrtA system glycosyltransferase [Stellaceae bacterium]|nr:TIGR03087 family PEP-CTERM/XrtA system glycosyltransferase [Stellaceae bacterium]